MNKPSVRKDIFLKLSHDLKNDFFVIRAATGSILKQSPDSESLDEKISVIRSTLNRASKRLDEVYILLEEDLKNER